MTLLILDPPIPPEAGAKNKPEVKLLVAEFGDGYTQSTPTINGVRNVFNATWPHLERQDADVLVAFFELHGGATPFSYTIPGSSKQLKWTCKEWEQTFDAANLSTVTATFRQSFNLGD